MSSKEEKPQRCLGIKSNGEYCTKRLRRGIFLCPACRTRNNSLKIARAEEPRKIIISHKITKDQY